MRNLRGIDLNLLVTLEALLIERNVTRAAKRLHLSQPSVSVQLRKLRHLFGDQLLLPGPRGMLPTARALELLEPLRATLSGLVQLVDSGAPFDPASATLTWHIACADYAEQAILLPGLLDIRRAAPGVRVAVHPLIVPQVAKMAELGSIDLAILTADMAPTTLHRRGLFVDRYVLTVRNGHPVLKKPLTVTNFCELEYILVSPDGGGFVGVIDTLLETRRRKRRVSLSVPHFLFVPELVRNSDLVAMLPTRLVANSTHGLQVIEPPIPVPGFEMVMVWHERSHKDPGHRWLRDRIAAATSAARIR
jgi:DNA-binding transcriptional LysR family regulator